MTFVETTLSYSGHVSYSDGGAFAQLAKKKKKKKKTEKKCVARFTTVPVIIFSEPFYSFLKTNILFAPSMPWPCSSRRMPP